MGVLQKLLHSWLKETDDIAGSTSSPFPFLLPSWQVTSCHPNPPLSFHTAEVSPGSVCLCLPLDLATFLILTNGI